MDLAQTSTVLTCQGELFSIEEETALAGFLAGYSGLTREAYACKCRRHICRSAFR
jgi:hypothetical protein